MLPPESPDFTSVQNLLNYQAKVIRDLAQKESCVIVGRCADFILRDLDNVLRIYVHAPIDYCIEKTIELHPDFDAEEARRFIQRTDKGRQRLLPLLHRERLEERRQLRSVHQQRGARLGQVRLARKILSRHQALLTNKADRTGCGHSAASCFCLHEVHKSGKYILENGSKVTDWLQIPRKRLQFGYKIR